MNNHRFVLLTAALLVVFAAAAGAVANAADGPKLVVPEKIKDMGVVAPAAPLPISIVRLPLARPATSRPSSRPAIFQDRSRSRS